MLSNKSGKFCSGGVFSAVFNAVFTVIFRIRRLWDVLQLKRLPVRPLVSWMSGCFVISCTARVFESRLLLFSMSFTAFYVPLHVFDSVYEWHVFFVLRFVLVLWRWLVVLQDLNCHVKLVVVIAVTNTRWLFVFWLLYRCWYTHMFGRTVVNVYEMHRFFLRVVVFLAKILFLKCRVSCRDKVCNKRIHSSAIVLVFVCVR